MAFPDSESEAYLTAVDTTWGILNAVGAAFIVAMVIAIFVVVIGFLVASVFKLFYK